MELKSANSELNLEIDKDQPTPYNAISSFNSTTTSNSESNNVSQNRNSVNNRVSMNGVGDALKPVGGQYTNTADISAAILGSTSSGIDKSKQIAWRELDIEKELGRGAYGVVYKAEFRTSPVAVKELLKVNAETSAAFVQEAEVWARVKTHAVSFEKR